MRYRLKWVRNYGRLIVSQNLQLISINIEVHFSFFSALVSKWLDTVFPQRVNVEFNSNDVGG